MSQYADSHFTHTSHYPQRTEDYPHIHPPHAPGLERTESDFSSSTLPHKVVPMDMESGDLEHQQSPPPRPTKRWWESVIPTSLACRLYIGLVIAETIIDLTVEADIYNRIKKAADKGTIEATILLKQGVYLSIFALAHMFQLALAIDAVANRNTLQFLFLAVLNVVFLAYACFQSGELHSILASSGGDIPDTALSATIITAIAVAQVGYIGLGWQIWREFGWKVYKFLGADRRIKRMYLHYQIFESLVKFDVFFWVGFSIQLIFIVLNHSDWEYYVTILALPLAILLLIQGHLAARYENKWMMYSFMLGCMVACVYFIYKLFKIWQPSPAVGQKLDNLYTPVQKSLTIFASISLFFLLCTFVLGCIVLNNFGNGLKDQMSKKNKNAKSGTIRRRGTEHLPKGEHYEMSNNRNRMSID